MVRPTFNPSESESSGGLSVRKPGTREPRCERRAFGRRPQDGRRCHSKYFVSVSLCHKRGPPPTLSHFGDPTGRAGQGKERPYLPWVVCACPESSGVSSLSGNLEREANTV